MSSDEPALHCEAAAAHLHDCLGEPVTVPADCDPMESERVLAQSCSELLDPRKAEVVDNWLCDLGLLRHCPAPGCTPDAPTQMELDDAQSCADFIDLEGCASCDYYLCRDQARDMPCGTDGYYAGFGHEYCDRFSELTVPRLSPAGQQWISDVRVCLQLALEDVDDSMACDDLREFAYSTHPECYVQTGFCSLPLSDLWMVVNSVALVDLGFRQPLVTGVSCIGELFDPQTLELSDAGIRRLQEARLIASDDAPRDAAEPLFVD